MKGQAQFLGDDRQQGKQMQLKRVQLFSLSWKNRPVFIRNFEFGRNMDNFLVSGVATVLSVRLILKLTGYPQIGGGMLHIAHLLWGGLLMTAALITAFAFLDRASARVSSIVGGIGFGLFIDEVGKFVTRDIDYFFKPAVALIYITFVLIFLAARSIESGRKYSNQEYLMNAMQELGAAMLHGVDNYHREHFSNYLEKSRLDSQLADVVRGWLSQVEQIQPPRKGLLSRIKRRVHEFYDSVADTRAFSSTVVVVFVVDMLSKIVHIFAVIFLSRVRPEKIAESRILEHLIGKVVDLSFAEWAQLAPTILSSALMLIGVLSIKRSRLFAFRMFYASIMVSLLVTQVFTFYREQFYATVWLFINLILYFALRFVINRERLHPQL